MKDLEKLAGLTGELTFVSADDNIWEFNSKGLINFATILVDNTDMLEAALEITRAENTNLALKNLIERKEREAIAPYLKIKTANAKLVVENRKLRAALGDDMLKEVLAVKRDEIKAEASRIVADQLQKRIAQELRQLAKDVENGGGGHYDC